MEHAEIDFDLNTASPMLRSPLRRLEAAEINRDLNNTAQHSGCNGSRSPPRTSEDAEINRYHNAPTCDVCKMYRDRGSEHGDNTQNLFIRREIDIWRPILDSDPMPTIGAIGIDPS